MATELRMLNLSLRQTQARLLAFEQQHRLATADFVARYARNEIAETLETLEWLGEYRMALSIQDQIDGLRAIQFGH